MVDATTFKFLISLAIKEELELYDPLENVNPLKIESITTRKHEINDGGVSREFFVKEALRGISKETRFVVTRSS